MASGASESGVAAVLSAEAGVSAGYSRSGKTGVGRERGVDARGKDQIFKARVLEGHVKAGVLEIHVKSRVLEVLIEAWVLKISIETRIDEGIVEAGVCETSASERTPACEQILSGPEGLSEELGLGLEANRA